MTPQESKNSILQLAIQGKLVEQRPEEGTGEELYRQIQAEKKRLIKAGKIKKDKPMPEIAEDEIPFDIPENWKWVRIGTVATILGGKRIPAGRKLSSNDTGYIYIRVSDMKDGYVSTENLQYVPEDIFQSISKYIIHKEDVFITVAGTIGRVGKIPPELDGANLTENADRLAFSLMDQDWLIKCMQSSLVQNQIADATTKVGQPKLAIIRIQNMLIPLPPLSEQKRIVAKIEELLPYIDRYAASYERLEQVNTEFPEDMKKSVLQYAIQGKLVEQRPEEGTAEELYRQIQAEKQRLVKEGKIKKEKLLPEIAEDEIPFDIPESWKWVRLSDLCKSISDGDHQPPPQVPNGIPFLVISNVSSGTIDFASTRYVPQDYFEALSAERIAERGDILFTVTGSYGIPIKVNCDKAFCFQRHIALLKLLIDWDYLFFALKSPAIKLQCDAIATGTAQKTVGLKSLRSIILPLPPLAEQKRIVAKLEEILPLCERLK